MDLSQLLSVLPLDMTPSGYETSDLLVLMSAEGEFMPWIAVLVSTIAPMQV
jgi:hypothetical protein